MKPLIFVLLLISFFCIQSGFSQNPKDNIEQEFNAYLTTIVNNEFEKSVEYLDEDFLEIIPKEQMILVMEKAINNPDLEFEFLESDIINIEDIEKIDEKYYAMVNYSSIIKMRFLNLDEEGQTEEEKALSRNMLKLQFEKTFGEDNVSYDESTEFYTLHAVKKACAISRNGETEWKYVVLEPEQKFILEKFLPEEIIQKI